MGERVMRQATAGVTAAVLLLGALPARAQDGAGSTTTTTTTTTDPAAPPPADLSRPPVLVPTGSTITASETTYESRPRYGLLATGGTIFAVSYLATVIANGAISNAGCRGFEADLGCRTADWPLYIPVAGPFVQMGYLDGDNRNVGRALLAVDGAVQGAGLTLFLIGALARKRVPAQSRTVQISSFSPAGGAGLSAFGSF